MSRTTQTLAALLVLVVVLSIGFTVVFERVPPTEIGVRQGNFGGGLSQQDYTTGTYFSVTGMHRWHYLPRRTHFLHFSSSDTARGDGVSMWEPSMSIRTRDDNEISVDITVPYRIKEGEAWRIVADGHRLSYTDKVRSLARDVLRAELSRLSSEDLQITDLRIQRADQTLPLLNEKLAEFYVEAEAVLVRAVRFQRDYEAKLQDKQYLTQKALLDGALALQAREEQVTNSIEKQIGAEIKKKTAEWDKTIQEERSRYDVLIAEINAQADVYQRRVRAEGEADAVALEAEGQLAIDTAVALRDRLRNEVLDSQGGRIYLALEAARNLQVTDVTLNSNDPRVPLIIDLDELSGMLLGAAESP